MPGAPRQWAGPSAPLLCRDSELASPFGFGGFSIENARTAVRLEQVPHRQVHGLGPAHFNTPQGCAGPPHLTGFCSHTLSATATHNKTARVSSQGLEGGGYFGIVT
jgi:hypothetical protein